MYGNSAEQNDLNVPYNVAENANDNAVYSGQGAPHVPALPYNFEQNYAGQHWSGQPVYYGYGQAQLFFPVQTAQAAQGVALEKRPGEDWQFYLERLITCLAEYQDPQVNHIAQKLEEANLTLKQEKKTMQSKIKEMKVAYDKQQDKLERYEHLMGQGIQRSTH